MPLNRNVGSLVLMMMCAAFTAGRASAYEMADPRGPLLPAPSGHPDAAVMASDIPWLGKAAFVSSGYRSIHVESNFTGSFLFPFHITSDQDQLFVSDATGNIVSIYQIIAGGGVTFVRSFGSSGSGAGQFSGPEQVAVVGNDVFVADFGNHRIQRFNRNTGAYISQFGAFGSGAGQFNSPSGLAYNASNGMLYVSDVGNDRVQMFETTGVYRGQFGAPGSGNGQLNNPYAIAIDSFGRVHVADSVNNRVSVFNASGTWQRHSAIGITGPLGIAIDRSDMMWVTSTSGDIYAYDAQGNYNAYYYGSHTTWEAGYFLGARGITVTAPLPIAPYNGRSAIAVVDGTSQNVQLFSRSAQAIVHPPINSITGIGSFNGQVAFDSAENIYFTSLSLNRVYKYDKFGNLLLSWGSTGTGNGQFVSPYGITVDDNNNGDVADSGNHRIQRFDSNGGYLLQFGAFGSGDGQFSSPANLATDGSWLYVADENNDRIQKFSLTGNYVRKWGTVGTGNGQMNNPLGIAVDRKRNQVYVSEFFGNRVQQFTVFGDFIKILSDSTSGTGALSSPRGMATDQHGNLLVSDGTGGGRVVQFNDNGTYLTNFAVPAANGMGIDLQNGQIHVGSTIGDGIRRFGATIGKTDTVGVFRPTSGEFLLRFANSAGAPNFYAKVAGANSTDLPVVGDWNGDGVDTPGLYRPATSTFYLWEKWLGLNIAAADHVLNFGSAGDRPLSGDWNGDGIDGIGTYRPSTQTYFLKNDFVGAGSTYAVVFGSAGDVPVAGDWNLDGAGSVGAFRPADARFHISNRNVSASVSEDGQYALGAAGDLPVTGDWTHSGYNGIGVFRPSNGTFYLKYDLDNLPADATFAFGTSGDLPIAGNWGAPVDLDRVFRDGFE